MLHCGNWVPRDQLILGDRNFVLISGRAPRPHCASRRASSATYFIRLCFVPSRSESRWMAWSGHHVGCVMFRDAMLTVAHSFGCLGRPTRPKSCADTRSRRARRARALRRLRTSPPLLSPLTSAALYPSAHSARSPTFTALRSRPTLFPLSLSCSCCYILSLSPSSAPLPPTTPNAEYQHLGTIRAFVRAWARMASRSGPGRKCPGVHMPATVLVHQRLVEVLKRPRRARNRSRGEVREGGCHYGREPEQAPPRNVAAPRRSHRDHGAEHRIQPDGGEGPAGIPPPGWSGWSRARSSREGPFQRHPDPEEDRHRMVNAGKGSGRRAGNKRIGVKQPNFRHR